MLEAIAVFSAAFLQSITGFGFAIVTAPILMLFYPAKFVVVMMVILALAANCMQVTLLWRNAVRNLVAGLVCGSLIGQQMGIYIYNGVTDSDLKMIISLLILFSISLIQFFKVKVKICFRNSLIVGVFSGVMAVLTSMSGPPIIIYFLCADLPSVNIRGTCVVFFMLSNILSTMTFLMNGIDFAPVLGEMKYLLPATALGIFAGHKAFRYVKDYIVRKLMYSTLYGLCIYNIYEYFAG